MKRKILVPAFVIAALAALAYSVFVPTQTPAGQPPLASFDRASFDRQFRAAAGETRLLVLLSPT